MPGHVPSPSAGPGLVSLTSACPGLLPAALSSGCWCSGLLRPRVGWWGLAHWCSYFCSGCGLQSPPVPGAIPKLLWAVDTGVPNLALLELSTQPWVHSPGAAQPLPSTVHSGCFPALTLLSVSFDAVRINDLTPFLPGACGTCCWRAGPHRVLCRAVRAARALWPPDLASRLLPRLCWRGTGSCGCQSLPVSRLQWEDRRHSALLSAGRALSRSSPHRS